MNGITMIMHTAILIPLRIRGDESHCILKFCNKHAEEFKLVQKDDNVKGLDIQVKDKKHHRHL